MTDNDRHDQNWSPDEPIVVPITDVIDLHHFNPKEVPDLLDEYIRACLEQGILTIRIIHGKGKGVLKERVRTILSNHPHVRTFQDAPMGNWGATRAELVPAK